MTRPTKAQQILDGSAHPPDNPYVQESSAFRAYIQQRKVEAQRQMDDLDGEIDHLQAEIEARLVRRADLQEITMRADAALLIDIPVTRPAPQLTPGDALRRALADQASTDDRSEAVRQAFNNAVLSQTTGS